MNHADQYNQSLARQAHTMRQRDAPVDTNIAVDHVVIERSHSSRRATLARIRAHTRRPSRLRDFVTPDTTSGLGETVAQNLTSEDTSEIASISPYIPAHLAVSASAPTEELSSKEKQLGAEFPEATERVHNPRSVKHMTCHWWATKVCKYTEEECLYAHSVQKTVGDQPRKLEPNGPPVAGRNAHSSRPIRRNWRNAHQLPSSANDQGEGSISVSSQPQAQLQQLAKPTQDIEPEIEALWIKRGFSESVIADICNKVDSELRRGRSLQLQMGYFEAVPKTEIIMKWVTEVNDIVRQHRIIIDSINEKLMALGRL